MKALLLLALLLPLGSSAAARKKPFYCTPVAQLTERLSSCTYNETVIAEAAVACLQKFEKEADQAAAELTRSLGSPSAGGQESSLNSGVAAYTKAITRLSSLISNGQLALTQVAEYRSNLALPEDFESAPNMGFTVEEFLKSIPCFEENRQVLVDVGKDFLKKLNELKSVRDLAKMERATAEAARNQVGEAGLPGVQAASNTHAEGAAVKRAPQKNGHSDITGTTKRRPAGRN